MPIDVVSSVFFVECEQEFAPKVRDRSQISFLILNLRPRMPYVVFWTVLVLVIFRPLPVAFRI